MADITSTSLPKVRADNWPDRYGMRIMRNSIRRTQSDASDSSAPRIALIGQSILHMSADNIAALVSPNATIMDWSAPGASAKTTLLNIDMLTYAIETYGPTHLVVFKGANDLLQKRSIDSIRRDMRGILDSLTNTGKPIILVGLTPEHLPIAQLNETLGESYISDAVYMYEQLASEYGIALVTELFHSLEPNDFLDLKKDYIDIGRPGGNYTLTRLGYAEKFAALADLLESRSIHPNQEGQHKIAENVVDALKTLDVLLPEHGLSDDITNALPKRGPNSVPFER